MKLKEIIKKTITIFNDFLFSFVKVKDNYVIFFSSRNRVDGNPKAIYLYLKEHYKNDFKLIYLVNKNTNISDLEKEDVYYYNSLKGIYYISKGRYWILSDSISILKSKKKSQVYIQTFHGHGPVKKFALETDKKIPHELLKNGVIKHVLDWEIYISMCKEDEEHIKNGTGYKNLIYRLGVASTDEIVKSNLMTKKEVINIKNKYNIPLDKKVILYAPTYREKLIVQEKIDIKIKELKKLKDYIVLIRLHPLLNSKLDKKIFDKSNFINACDIPDIVDLYPITDILISDYSASIYEFALTNKKIILYPYDYKEYDKDTGIVIDYEKVMPGPICYTEKELYNTIIDEKTSFKNYNKKLKEFNKKFNYLNDGNATKRFVDKIIDGTFKNKKDLN